MAPAGSVDKLNTAYARGDVVVQVIVLDATPALVTLPTVDALIVTEADLPIKGRLHITKTIRADKS